MNAFEAFVILGLIFLTTYVLERQLMREVKYLHRRIDELEKKPAARKVSDSMWRGHSTP